MNCVAITKLGFRCSRKKKIGNYCSQHNKNIVEEVHIEEKLTSEAHIREKLTSEAHIEEKLTSEIHIEEKLTSEAPSSLISDLLSAHIKYCKTIKHINNHLKTSKKIRAPNFPSEISENIVRLIIKEKLGYEPSWIEGKTGDLTYEGKKIEVKAFSSRSPTSFGPKENWDIIYFLDCIDFMKSEYVCYEIKLSNKSKEWMNLKVNKNETFFQHCEEKRRPRIRFESIKEQLGEHCKIIFEGVFNLDQCEA